MRHKTLRIASCQLEQRQRDVQHAEVGVLYLVQVAAVCAQLLYGLSKHFLPKGVAQPRYNLGGGGRDSAGRHGRKEVGTLTCSSVPMRLGKSLLQRSAMRKPTSKPGGGWG